MTKPGKYDTLWVRRFHAASSGAPRLVCFPHAGGSASFFRPVSQHLSPEVEVLVLQYPGRQDRRHEALVTDIGKLADLITAALGTDGAGPTVFFGHSMGALVAYEVALRAERADAGPGAVIASGRRAPSRYRPENLHRASDDEAVAEIRKLGGTDINLLASEEVLRTILPAIRGDYHAVETYRSSPDVRLSCAVTALVGDDDPRTTVDEADAWRHHTDGNFELRVFPGGHFYFIEQQKAVIAEILGVVRQLSTVDYSATGKS